MSEINLTDGWNEPINQETQRFRLKLATSHPYASMVAKRQHQITIFRAYILISLPSAVLVTLSWATSMTSPCETCARQLPTSFLFRGEAGGPTSSILQ